MRKSNKRRKENQLWIAGQRIGRGKTYDLEIAYSESYTGIPVTVPLRVVSAPKPGPIVCLMAVIHGDELNGLGIIRELVFERDIGLRRGTIVAVPVANIYGIEHHSRYLPDRRDLNRSFPGASSGSLTSRLAHVLFNEVVAKCDYGLDFHTAAVRRTNYPNIRADLSNPEVRRIARAFGCELIVHNKGAEGSLRRAATAHGIPTIVLEAGEVWKIEPAIVDVAVKGTLNFLNELKMIDQSQEPPPFQAEIRRTKWIRSERGGILKFHVLPGQAVRKGQVLATNLGIFGHHQHQVISPAKGYVLGVSTMPAVKPGDPIFHLAIPSAQVARQIPEERAEPNGQSFHDDVQRDLATNILVDQVRRRKRT